MLRSSIVLMPAANSNSSIWLLGSKPGFSSSFIMSVSVGIPTLSVTYLFSSIFALRSLSCISCLTVQPLSCAICSTILYDSGCTALLSRGLADSGILRKPAHCSKAAGPRRGTFFSWLRLVNAPFCRLYSTMFFASVGPSPLTYVNRCWLAVLRFTPTEFTQLSTVRSSVFFSFDWSTSCWYCPTPMLFGSIFTSSARGSMSRRPMLTAPRTVTSLSGNSSRAIFDAE